MKWNGTRVTGKEEFEACVAVTADGLRVPVEVIRQGQCRSLFVILGHVSAQ